MLAFAACSCGSRQPPVQRIAILPFENLTGDASFDWVAGAAPLIIADEITGLPDVFPLRAATTSEAYLSSATRFIRGYFTRRGNTLEYNIDMEDTARHKTVEKIDTSGDILSAMRTVARRLYPAAHEFATSNTEAIAAWGRGDYERATAIDPDFGEAWLTWSRVLLASGQADRALEVARQGLNRPGLRSSVARARLELTSANLRKDSGAEATALAALSRLVTTDVDTIRALADAQVNARKFADAAALYRNILRLDPDNMQTMNLLGYAEAYGGNLEAAKRSLEQYRRQPDQEANAIDSLGEACFMNGQFAEAAGYFLLAHQANSAMQQGGDLLKAAYAQWLAGDLRKADTTYLNYLKFRAGLHDPLVVFREATWLYTTGRADQARGKLRDVTGPVAQLAQRQLAVWQTAAAHSNDAVALENIYYRTPPSNDGQVRTFYAEALADRGRKEQARSLVERWPLPETGGDPLLQSLVFPRFMELRRNLGVVKK